MGGKSGLKEHLEDPGVPIVMKMGEFIQWGSSMKPVEFLELWKIVRLHTWKALCERSLTGREKELQGKLRKMAKYKKKVLRDQPH